MRQLMTLMVFMGLALASSLSATPAQAQAPRTWVSGTGNDANPCSRTSPCRTFAGAIAKTILNGEISCLDAGGFDTVTISKSITIDCHDVFASILNAGTNGINILFDNFGPADTRKTVRLRNLNINGLATGLIGINITGATNAENSAVFIEDCLVDGMFAGPMRGISDTRNAGELSISGTTVRNIGGTAIAIAPVDGGRRIEATLDNVRAQNAELGIGIGKPARVLINRSFNRTGLAGPTTSFGNNRISGNTAAGTAPTAAGPTSNDFGQQ